MRKIIKYETKQLLRDKKTIFFVFILPLIIFPLINGLLSKIITSRVEEITEEKVQIVSQKDQFLNEIFEKFRGDSVFTIVYCVNVDNTDSLLKLYPAVVTTEYSDSLKLNLIIVTYSAKKDKESIQAGNLIKKLRKIRDCIVEERFREIGIEDYFKKSAIIIKNIATRTEKTNSENANLLPVTIIMILLLGTFMISNYIILGEKDNNTLESLLSSGIKREHIIYGKMSMVFLTGLIMSVLELISFFLYGKFSGAMNFNISLNAEQIYSFIFVVVTVSVLVSSISVFISCKLKSSISGQLVFLPLMLLYLVLSLLGTFEGVVIQKGLLLLPVINSAGIIKAVIKDQYLFSEVVIVAVSNLFYSLLIVKSASDYLNGEDILNKNSDLDFVRKGFSKGSIFTIYA
ncbi:MAG: ABC transporter permease subunit, partial [Candidatus Delongbacteria bacterium]|nr:ABC transporter permease subunit [Candidatus Delongbacteria bacterium]